MNRSEIAARRALLAQYRSAHKKLIATLRTRSYDPREAEQDSYLAARVFWIREYPRFVEMLRASGMPNGSRDHRLYVLKQSFNDASVKGANRILRDLAHVNDINEAATAGEDLFQAYEAYLDREEASIPSSRSRFGAMLGRAWRWVASRPDWIEAHPQTIRLALIIGAVILAAFVPAILHELTEFVRALRGA